MQVSPAVWINMHCRMHGFKNEIFQITQLNNYMSNYLNKGLIIKKNLFTT